MATNWRGQYSKYREFSLNLLAIYKERQDVKAFLELVLSLSTLIVFIVFALKPTALTMISLTSEINEKQNTLNGLNQKISDLQTANSIFSQNQNVIPDIDNAIFTVPQPVTIAKQIIGVAKNDSVTILGVSIGKAVIIGKGGGTKEAENIKPLPESANALPVSISVKGSYSDLNKFVKDIENLRIPVYVDSLTINSSQSETANTIVQLINGRVPYLGNIPNLVSAK